MLIRWGTKLLRREGFPLANDLNCCCGVGCFTCIDPLHPDQWEVELVATLTGCAATWNGNWGWFALSAHPSVPDWCLASGSLPPGCDFYNVGFLWTWELDGTIRLQIVDDAEIVCEFTSSTAGCDFPFDLVLTGDCGTIAVTVRAVP